MKNKLKLDKLEELLDEYFNFVKSDDIYKDYKILKNFILSEQPLISKISKELKHLGAEKPVYEKIAVMILKFYYRNLSLSRRIKRQEKGRSAITQKAKAGIGKTYKWDYLKDEIDKKWNKDPKKNFRNCVKSVVLERLKENEDPILGQEYKRKNKDLEGLVDNIYRFFSHHYN